MKNTRSTRAKSTSVKSARKTHTLVGGKNIRNNKSRRRGNRVRHLFHGGMDNGDDDEEDDMALFIAVQNRDAHALKPLLVTERSRINELSNEDWDHVGMGGRQWTLLHLALIHEDEIADDPPSLQIVKMLLDVKGLDVNKKDSEGKTPLMVAKGVDFVKLLLGHRDIHGPSSVKKRSTKRDRLVSGKKKQSRTGKGRGVSHHVDLRHRAHAVKKISTLPFPLKRVRLVSRAKQSRTGKGRRVSHRVDLRHRAHGHITVNINVNERDNNGSTALWLLANLPSPEDADGAEEERGEDTLEIAQLLIDAGADVDIRGADGTTPLEAAEKRGFGAYVEKFSRIARRLPFAKARNSIKDVENSSAPLMKVLQNDDLARLIRAYL